jgi:hypothetical protein
MTGGAVQCDLSFHKRNDILGQRKAKLAPAEKTRHRLVPIHEGVEYDLLLLKNHPDPGGGKIELVACTTRRRWRQSVLY